MSALAQPRYYDDDPHQLLPCGHTMANMMASARGSMWCGACDREAEELARTVLRKMLGWRR
jgi:hypothetical protein